LAEASNFCFPPLFSFHFSRARIFSLVPPQPHAHSIVADNLAAVPLKEMTSFFVKPWRQAVLKTKPNGMIEAEWEAIFVRLKYSMMERQGRRIKAVIKKRKP
jgi:hypothetical protein